MIHIHPESIEDLRRITKIKRVAIKQIPEDTDEREMQKEDQGFEILSNTRMHRKVNGYKVKLTTGVIPTSKDTSQQGILQYHQNWTYESRDRTLKNENKCHAMLQMPGIRIQPGKMPPKSQMCKVCTILPNRRMH